MIINLTMHSPTPAQEEDGLISLPREKAQELHSLLLFTEKPSEWVIKRRAEEIARLAVGYERALIGGAPYLASALEAALRASGVKPVYAFTARNVIETVNQDGSITKTSVFDHIGWVSPP